MPAAVPIFEAATSNRAGLSAFRGGQSGFCVQIVLPPWSAIVVLLHNYRVLAILHLLGRVRSNPVWEEVQPMATRFMDVVREAIWSWSMTFRLCIIIVVAATMTIYFYLMGVPALPGLMR